jgi:uncharacterized protein (TIGR04255 family)
VLWKNAAMIKKNTTSASRRARQYQFPPIREAVIEILINSASPSSIESLKTTFEGEQGTVNDLYETHGEVILGPGVSASSQQRRHVGYILQGSNFSFQARDNGFAVNRIGLYKDWKELRNEAQRVWDKYCHIRKPESIVRIGLRYINRLNIPRDISELSKYVTTFPQLSNEIGAKPNEFFLRLAFPLHKVNAKAIVNEALIEKTEDGIAVVLDIDVFRDNDLSHDTDGIWALFDKLRTEKNRIFESCITEKMRDIFNNDHTANGLRSGATPTPNRRGQSLPSLKRGRSSHR